MTKGIYDFSEINIKRSLLWNLHNHYIQGPKKVYLIAGMPEDQMGTGLTQNI